MVLVLIVVGVIVGFFAVALIGRAVFGGGPGAEAFALGVIALLFGAPLGALAGLVGGVLLVLLVRRMYSKRIARTGHERTTRLTAEHEPITRPTAEQEPDAE